MAVSENPNELILLSVREVCRRVGLSRPSIYTRMAADDSPDPYIRHHERRDGDPMKLQNGLNGSAPNASPDPKNEAPACGRAGADIN